MGFCAAQPARTRPRAPRWVPARAPIRGGRSSSPAWGDCAEPMASLAASTRLHRRPASRSPGGALEPGSRGLRPGVDGRIQMAASRGEGEGRRGLSTAPPSPTQGRLDFGQRAGRRGSAGLPGGWGGGAPDEAENVARGQATGCKHLPVGWTALP